VLARILFNLAGGHRGRRRAAARAHTGASAAAPLPAAEVEHLLHCISELGERVEELELAAAAAAPAVGPANTTAIVAVAAALGAGGRG
jgi:hypothetical protein